MAVELVRWREAIAAPLPAREDSSSTVRSTGRSIENLVLLLFWLVIMEGTLRKWVWPEYSRWLFFVRDPFLLVLYWQAVRAQVLRNAGPFLWIGGGFAVVAVVVAFAQSISIGEGRMLPMLIYGWRQYFFYLPLPFIIAATFDRESLLRFGKHALVAVIFTAPLVLAQYASPASAVINRGSSDDVALQFKAFDLLGDRIRPSGLFTTNVGVKELVASSAALLFAAWLTAPAQRRMSHLWLLAGAAGIAACLAVSGSRAAFAHVALVVIAAMGVGVLTRNPQVRIRALTVPLALCALGAILYPIVFPDALQTMLARVVAASAVESRNSPLGFFGRVLADYIGFIYQLGDTPLLGWGLGLGGNGRTFLGDTSALPLDRIYAESEWTRHIVDLGMVGVLLILYRIAAFLALLSASLRATRVSQSPFPLLLFGYAGYLLLGGQVTGNGTVGGFAWLFIGLCMAACRTSLERR